VPLASARDGYWLVSITKRYSIFDGLPSKPSAAQTPSTSPQKYRNMKTRLHAHTVVANPRHSRAMSAVYA
jgi:hypothetical protein